MNCPETYPGSRVKITAPFFLLACSCGYSMWSVLGEPTLCPKCRRTMVWEGADSIDTSG